MPQGPGKYNDTATAAREATGAEGVVLFVIRGKHGNGFSVQATLGVTRRLPMLLRELADAIEKDMQSQ